MPCTKQDRSKSLVPKWQLETCVSSSSLCVDVSNTDLDGHVWTFHTGAGLALYHLVIHNGDEERLSAAIPVCSFDCTKVANCSSRVTILYVLRSTVQ